MEEDVEYNPLPSDERLLTRVTASIESVEDKESVDSLRRLVLDSDWRDRVESSDKPRIGPGSNSSAFSLIPSELRAFVYLKLLIGPKAEDKIFERDSDGRSFLQEAIDAENVCPDVSQIWLDVNRARAKLDHFKQESIRLAMVRLLCLLCNRNGVKYAQGFHEILAPFMIMPGIKERPRLIYHLFSAFVDQNMAFLAVLKHSDNDSDGAQGKDNGNLPKQPDQEAETLSDSWDGLKLCFRALDSLLLYHDPELAVFLSAAGLSAQIYSPNWFMTACSRVLRLELCYVLWDLIVLENEPAGLLFFVLALMIRNRIRLLSESQHNIPQVLVSLRPTSVAETLDTWKMGMDLMRKGTPCSVVDSLTSGLFRSYNKSRVTELWEDPIATALGCLTTSADDLMAHNKRQSLSSERANVSDNGPGVDDDTGDAGDASRAVLASSFMEYPKPMGLFVLDCRTSYEYESGHYPCGAYVKLDAVRTFVNSGSKTEPVVQSASAEFRSERSSASVANSFSPTKSTVQLSASSPNLGASSPKRDALAMKSPRSPRQPVDPPLPAHETELKEILKFMKPLEGNVQFSLCGTGYLEWDVEDVAQLANHLIKRQHVKQISILRGGFNALLEFHQKYGSDFELADWNDVNYRAAKSRRAWLKNKDNMPLALRLSNRMDLVRAKQLEIPVISSFVERNQEAFVKLQSAVNAFSSYWQQGS
eukprot:CAMPEP_0184706464 /NCGR_PEP_ID=MMETSP0313-20130426/36773_1 /TAXON_ID=2792 /ORGANISM="Porphyridium aerugineum, Strain SAG 1380-2" /LENGTH=703 /DNA_ID=CAMNT_0027168017 /DNA_START=135 /DNA_END=2246 /DNA_ORIENTATION=-